MLSYDPTAPDSTTNDHGGTWVWTIINYVNSGFGRALGRSTKLSNLTLMSALKGEADAFVMSPSGPR